MSARYQLLPDLAVDEYAALRDDIIQNGFRTPVDVDEDGRILDGHHRVRVAEELDIDYPTRMLPGLSDEAKRAHALAVNIHRRQLTRDQKRELIQRSLKADPDLPDVRHAERTGSSDKTVSDERSRLVASSEIPNSSTRRYSDGTERVVPQRADPEPQLPARQDQAEQATAEDDQQHGEPPEEPEPEPQPPTRRRKPLTDTAQHTGWDLRKNVEKTERIFTDDRFPSNKKQVAAHLRGHLTYTIQVCQDLLNRIDETSGEYQ